MGKKAFEDAVASVMAKFNNVKDSTKRKLGAGLLAAGFLLGGFMGCTNTSVDNVDELDTKDIVMEDKIDAESYTDIGQDRSEVEFGTEVDLDEMVSVLEQMLSDMHSGVRTDFHEVFIEAERFDQILDEIGKLNLDESKLKYIKTLIYLVQEDSIQFQTYSAICQSKSDTGCFIVGFEGNEETSNDRISGFVSFDDTGKMVRISRDGDGEATSVAVLENDKLISWDAPSQGTHEKNIGEEFQEFICGGELLVKEMLNSYRSDSEHSDWTYSVDDGYTKCTRQERRFNIGEKDGLEIINYIVKVKFDENGKVESLSHFETEEFFLELASDGSISEPTSRKERHLFVNIDSISQEKINQGLKMAKTILENVNIVEDGSQSE